MFCVIDMGSIILFAFGGSSWIGGIYYIRNIAYSLSLSKRIRERYRIVIFTGPEQRDVFEDLDKDCIRVKTITGICGRGRRFFVAKWCLLYKCHYLMYGYNRIASKIGATTIEWIPDFQHNHFPEFFSEDEIESRTKSYWRIKENDNKLILSSYDALKDFNQFYSGGKKETYVVHFVSYLRPIIERFDAETEAEVLERYHLQHRKYACIMNQFWKHKNHITVFQAIEKYYAMDSDADLEFVFTGSISDYRDESYSDYIRQYISSSGIKTHIRLLGFIDRVDQLVLMKRAEFVIQPSLFEGWGTVVEDAKVLDKRVLLSDIPVHREQMYERCTLFDPHNPEELAELIKKTASEPVTDDIGRGLKRMEQDAMRYSEELERLFE